MPVLRQASNANNVKPSLSLVPAAFLSTWLSSLYLCLSQAVLSGSLPVSPPCLSHSVIWHMSPLQRLENQDMSFLCVPSAMPRSYAHRGSPTDVCLGTGTDSIYNQEKETENIFNINNSYHWHRCFTYLISVNVAFSPLRYLSLSLCDRWGNKVGRGYVAHPCPISNP